MNIEKKLKMLIPSMGLALILGGCQSSFLTNMDDKGTTLIGVFGLYPAHDNDPFLSIKCALSIVNSLEEKGIQAKVGITTGTVFAAEVGNDRRCEYAIIGDIVNMSARLMGATSKINKKLYENISILCDQATYKAINPPNKKLGVIGLNNFIMGFVYFTNTRIKKNEESSLWKIFIAALPIKVHIIIPNM